MDLSLTTEQEDLRDAVRRFVRDGFTVERIVAESQADVGVDERSWTTMAELGWMAMAIPADRGGLGASFTDMAVLFEQLGGGPVPGSVFESGVLAPGILLALPVTPLTDELLPLIADGQARVTVALATAPGLPATPAANTVSLTDGRLQGRALFVREAASATHHLVIASSNSGWACVVVDADAAGLHTTHLRGHAPRQFELAFDNVVVTDDRVVPLSAEDLGAVADNVLRALPVLCAYQVGSSQAVYQMTVDYSRQRVQFGKPIGTFQRVQDHIIDLANGLDTARWSTYHAVAKIDSEEQLPRAAVHVAKAATAEGHYQACTSSHEVHAGIGSDLQYGLAVHTFASRTLYAYLGDPAWHHRQLGSALGFSTS